MARSVRPRKPKRRSATTEAIVEARAQRIARKVEWYHALGTRAIEKDLSPKQIAAQHGLSLSMATKAKAFARGYNQTELRRYLRLRRPDGAALTVGYLSLLLTLPQKARDQVQRDIAQKGWLPPEAYRQVKHRYPQYRRQTTGSVGGRPSKYAPGSPEHLLWLVELAERLAKGLEQAGLDGPRLKSLRETARWLKRRAGK